MEEGKRTILVGEQGDVVVFWWWKIKKIGGFVGEDVEVVVLTADL